MIESFAKLEYLVEIVVSTKNDPNASYIPWEELSEETKQKYRNKFIKG